MGPNAVADAIAQKYSATKSQVFDHVSEESVCVCACMHAFWVYFTSVPLSHCRSMGWMLLSCILGHLGGCFVSLLIQDDSAHSFSLPLPLTQR